MTRRTEPSRHRAVPRATAPLRVTSIAVDATVIRALRLEGDAADAWMRALREAMLKRGCVRDRAHKGQCLTCALLPQCGVWPLIAPADPTRRQPGAFTRAWAPQPPTLPPGIAPEGTRITHGLTIIQDATFPSLWARFAAAYVQASRQLAEWGFGQPTPTATGPARRGALSVGHVAWRDPVRGEIAPFTFADEPMAPPIWYEETKAHTGAPSDASDALRVTFLTPLRLVAAGETRHTPDLPLLVRRIAERVTTLCVAFRVLAPRSVADNAADSAIAAAERVPIARDETEWIGDRMQGGLVGSITLHGSPDDLALLLPVLRWGMALAVGKGTQSGGGRIAVAPADE